MPNVNKFLPLIQIGCHEQNQPNHYSFSGFSNSSGDLCPDQGKT